MIKTKICLSQSLAQGKGLSEISAIIDLLNINRSKKSIYQILSYGCERETNVDTEGRV